MNEAMFQLLIRVRGRVQKPTLSRATWSLLSLTLECVSPRKTCSSSSSNPKISPFLHLLVFLFSFSCFTFSFCHILFFFLTLLLHNKYYWCIAENIKERENYIIQYTRGIPNNQTSKKRYQHYFVPDSCNASCWLPRHFTASLSQPKMSFSFSKAVDVDFFPGFADVFKKRSER